MSREALLRVARGQTPADLVLVDARVVDLLLGRVETTSVAVAGGRIAGLGDGYRGRVEVDLGGRFVAPGLIDAHVHVESALVPPGEFARAVVPHGVTTVITDPHEIANVCGLAGVRFMLDCAARVPLELFVNAPSCVPATHLESSGATLEATELAELLREPRVLGLAELMNYPGVIAADPAVMAKLDAFAGRAVDGHCPGLVGLDLNAYAAAGVGSDHESTTLAEAREKLARGLVVLIREATNARNLEALLPLVDEWSERRICLCTDDRQPADLLDQGSVDHMVRIAVARGVPPLRALRLASLNPAEHYGLGDRGAIAPGRRADLMVFSDLEAPRAEQVYIAGELVATDGEARFAADLPASAAVRDTVRVGAIDLGIAAAAPSTLRVIGLVPDQLITRELHLPATVRDGQAVADAGRDLLKMVVVERHRASGRTGKGFVQGLGLARGAIAGTVLHDHHNLVAIGADDASMATAARAVVAAGGGLAAALGDELLALLPLPIAGLMSDRPIGWVRRRMDELLAAARDLGSPLHDPYMAMSFLGLEVIPALKLTDLGLVDGERFARVSPFV